MTRRDILKQNAWNVSDCQKKQEGELSHPNRRRCLCCAWFRTEKTADHPRTYQISLFFHGKQYLVVARRTVFLDVDCEIKGTLSHV